MYPLDSRKNKYTWKPSWNLPYESLWGRIEKFRCVNVLEGATLNKLINIGTSSMMHFSNKHLIYYKNSYKIRYEKEFFPIDNKFCSNFIGLSNLFDHRIRYCPKCMANGYHSYIHQLTIMDNCFIHQNTKLKYRCSCPYTYIIKNKKLHTEIYQCEFCKEKIDVFPSVYDGITKLWDYSLIHNHKLPKHNNIKVSIFDFSYLETENNVNKSIKLSTIQKQILQDLFLNGKTTKSPRFIIPKDRTAENTNNVINMSETLNNYLKDNYDYETIMNHVGRISSRFCKYSMESIENVNIEILTILYIIKELQAVIAIDLLPYKNTWYEIRREYLFEKDNKYAPIIYDIMFNIYTLLDIRLEEYIDVYNIILKEWTVHRFKHIYNCFQYNKPEPYPCTGLDMISYDNWDYPTYIIEKNMDEEIRIY